MKEAVWAVRAHYDFRTLSDHEKRMLRVGQECDWCSSPAVLVEHSHRTHLVRGVACSACNALWRIQDAEVDGTAYDFHDRLLSVVRAAQGIHQRIQEALDQLISDAWSRRNIPGELERVDEIRHLVEEQLADDSPTPPRHQVGRNRVLHLPDEMNPYGTQSSSLSLSDRSPENPALQAAFDPFIELLTGEQRVLIRMIFGGRLTMREAGALLNITHVAVIKRLRVIYRELKQMLLVAFGPLPEDQEAPPVISWRGDWDSHLTVVEEPAWLDEPWVQYEHRPVDHLRLGDSGVYSMKGGTL